MCSCPQITLVIQYAVGAFIARANYISQMRFSANNLFQLLKLHATHVSLLQLPSTSRSSPSLFLENMLYTLKHNFLKPSVFPVNILNLPVLYFPLLLKKYI